MLLVKKIDYFTLKIALIFFHHQSWKKKPSKLENHHLMKLAQLLLSIITLETVICFGTRSP